MPKAADKNSAFAAFGKYADRGQPCVGYLPPGQGLQPTESFRSSGPTLPATFAVLKKRTDRQLFYRVATARAADQVGI